MGIWMRRGKIDSISFFKIILKRECIIIAATIFFLYSIGWVVYFLPISHPSDSMFAVIFFRKCQWLDSVTKHWLVFAEVYDVESDAIVRFWVIHLEVKPLSMTFCIYVILKNEVISFDWVSWLSIFWMAIRIEKISTLEMRIEADWIWSFDWILLLDVGVF